MSMRLRNEVPDEWADRRATEKVFNHSIAIVQCNKRKQDELEKAQAMAKSPLDMTGKFIARPLNPRIRIVPITTDHT
jgi:hypothetical protein